MANEQNLKPFKKGEVANPNGRPKKYVTLLREQGYKLSEINDTIQVMLQMGVDELKEVWDNPKATILEKTIANAMRKSLEKGSLYSRASSRWIVSGAAIPRPAELLARTI